MKRLLSTILIGGTWISVAYLFNVVACCMELGESKVIPHAVSSIIATSFFKLSPVAGGVVIAALIIDLRNLLPIPPSSIRRMLLFLGLAVTLWAVFFLIIISSMNGYGLGG